MAKNKKGKPSMPKKKMVVKPSQASINTAVKKAMDQMDSRITTRGMNFIKAVTAMPDLPNNAFKGVPDGYGEPTCRFMETSQRTFNVQGTAPSVSSPDRDWNVVNGSKSNTVTTPGIVLTGGRTCYILVLPVPGTAYMSTILEDQLQPGQNTNWDWHAADNFKELWGDIWDGSSPSTALINRSENFTQFRYGGMAAGIYPTNNQESYGGTVKAYKLPLTIGYGYTTARTTSATTNDSFGFRLNGFDGLHHMPPTQQYYKPYMEGAYSVSLPTKYEFQDVVEGCNLIGGKTAIDEGELKLPFIGMGTLESLVFEISVPPGLTSSFVIKTWKAMELVPNPRSIFDRFSSYPPPQDDVAMGLIKELTKNLPIAVRHTDNANYLSFVTSIAKKLLNHKADIKKVYNGFRMVGSGVYDIIK